MIRVLVVDDHPVVRAGMVALLGEQPDVEVVGEAGNGAEALALVPRLTPDVVLMDLSMPGMNGWQVTQILKSDTDTAAIPIVVLTAHDTTSERIRSVSEGCCGFLAKPCAPRILASEVARALGQAPPAH